MGYEIELGIQIVYAFLACTEIHGLKMNQVIVLIHDIFNNGLLAKWSDDHRLSIVDAGAVPYLLDHVYFSDTKLHEIVIMTLLNLSIYAP